MVKKIKQRPRRLFYDEKTKRYYYLINNKKKYINVPKDMAPKAIARVNIQNVLSVPTRRKAIRPRASIKPITNEQVVSKLVPIAPISQNLTSGKYDIYKPRDDLEKKLTKIEEQQKAKDVKDTTNYFASVSGPPKPSRLKTDFTPPLSPKSKSFYETFMSKIRPSQPTETKQPPKKPQMNSKQFEASLIQFDKKTTGEISVDDYPKYLEWQQGSKTYSKYEPPQYDLWTSNIRFLPELETLPPEEKEDLSKIAREARNKYFVPLKEGSKIMVKGQSPNENQAGDIGIKRGTLEGFGIYSFYKLNGNGDYENDDDGIFNDELQEIFKDKMNKFLPVIASDKMNTLLPLVNKDTKKFGWIQNTETSNSMGRHWVAYFIDVPNMEVNYYDSLVENDGIPPKESMKGLKKIIDKIHPEYYLKFKYSTIRDQHPSSKNCGYFALKFLMDRYRNVPFKSASGYDKVYEDYGEGEKMIKRFKKYL